jgi:hypothetical protein
MMGDGNDVYSRSIPWEAQFIHGLLYICGGEVPKIPKRAKGQRRPAESTAYRLFLDISWDVLHPRRKHKQERLIASSFKVPHSNNLWGRRFKPRKFHRKGNRWVKK